MRIRALTETESKVLAVLFGQADRPLPDLARSAAIKVHQFRYTLERLTERGLVRPSWVIDTMRIGLQRYALYFSLSPDSKRGNQQLLEQLSAHPDVIILQENGGDYDYEITVLARSAMAFYQFLDSLSGTLGKSLIVKSIATRLEHTHFPRKYIATLKKLGPELSIGGHSEFVDLDELDWKILKAMSNFPSNSVRDIARRLKRPESSIALRVVRLKAQKVIVGATIRTFPEWYGYQIYKLLVYAKGFDQKFKDELRTFARNHALCTTFIHSLGEWDFEIGLDSDERRKVIELRDEVSLRFGEYAYAVKVIPRFKSYKNIAL